MLVTRRVERIVMCELTGLFTKRLKGILPKTVSSVLGSHNQAAYALLT
jgi:hypothetical protein